MSHKTNIYGFKVVAEKVFFGFSLTFICCNIAFVWKVIFESVLSENGHFKRDMGPFAKQVIDILQDKYYQKQEISKVLGKSSSNKKGPRGAPMASAIHLRITGLTISYPLA